MSAFILRPLFYVAFLNQHWWFIILLKVSLDFAYYTFGFRPGNVELACG